MSESSLSKNVVVDTTSLPESTTSGVWDRISKWVSENKALVYTIAGVAVVVTSAGVVYYLSDSSSPAKAATASAAATEKKKTKNQKRREKKKAEEKAKSASVPDGMFILLSAHRDIMRPVFTPTAYKYIRKREKFELTFHRTNS